MIDKANPSLLPVFAGDILKEARMARGLSLEAVSKILRINKTQLLHLEDEKETLVCNIYTLGFLKSYAQFLELNSAALVQKFKEQTSASLPTSHLNFPTPHLEKGIPGRPVVLLSLLGFIGVVTGYAWWEAQRSTPLGVETPTAPALSSSPLPQKNLTKSTLPSKQTAVPAPRSVQLIATEETWVEIKNGKGEILLRRLLHPGETYTFTNPHDLILRTGNAGGLQLVSKEDILEFPKEKGMIRSHIPLDPTQWVDGEEEESLTP